MQNPIALSVAKAIFRERSAKTPLTDWRENKHKTIWRKTCFLNHDV